MKITVKRVKRPYHRHRFITAVDNKALFLHCANGNPSVTPTIWRKEVIPMLMLHGVTQIEEVE